MIQSRTRRVAGTAVALVAGLALGSAAVAETSEFQMPRLMVIGAAGTSGGSFASTNGWAPILQKDVGSMVRVVPEDNEAQRYRRLVERGDFRFVSVSSAEVRFQTLGIGGYVSTSPAAQRILWHHNDTPWGFVVAGDSPIQSMEDLKEQGGRISVAIQSPPMVTAVKKALPAYLGLSEDEVSEKFRYISAGSYGESCRSVVEGRADVAYCTPTSSVLSEMEGAPGGIRWLPMDMSNTEGWERFLDHRPMTVPAKMELGVSSGRGVEGLISNFLYVLPADADEEYAYNMAKWFHEKYDLYKNTHILASRMALENFRDYLNRSPLPVHDGTIRYLREIGQWTDEDDAWNQEAIEKMDRWVAARKAAMEEARAKRVEIDHENEAFMAILSRHTEGLEDFRSRL